jgi:hypothetical protein
MKLLPLLILAASMCAGEIVSAYGHIPGGGFRVPLPESQVPWKDLALRIVSKDVATPSETRLTDLWQNKDSFGIAEISFQAPIPETMKSRKYFVISDWGVTPLRLRSMVGGVRYRFDPAGTRSDLKEVGFQGAAIFDNVPEDEYVEGAFVIDSDTNLSNEAKEIAPSAIAVTRESQDATRITWSGKTGIIKSPATSRAEVASQFKIGNEDFLFLRWHPEGTSCEYIFTLLKIGASTLDETKNTVYGCDI